MFHKVVTDCRAAGDRGATAHRGLGEASLTRLTLSILREQGTCLCASLASDTLGLATRTFRVGHPGDQRSRDGGRDVELLGVRLPQPGTGARQHPHTTWARLLNGPKSYQH